MSQPVAGDLPNVQLATVVGGAAPTSGTSQAELRKLGQQYCPATYQQFQRAATITRPMAEKCLDEAGYGLFKGQLDKYFPRK